MSEDYEKYKLFRNKLTHLKVKLKISTIETSLKCMEGIFLKLGNLAAKAASIGRKKTKHTLINIGSGIEARIVDYAKFIMKKMNLKLKIKFNKKKRFSSPRGRKRRKN